MALTTGGSVSPDNSATGVYGSPPNATRMNREANTAAVAAEYTPGSGSDNTNEAFIDGSSLGTAETLKPGKSPSVPSTPGFPGLSDAQHPQL